MIPDKLKAYLRAIFVENFLSKLSVKCNKFLRTKYTQGNH